MTPRGAQEVLIIEDDQKIAAAAERCLLGIGLSPRVLRGRDLVSVFEHHDPALLIVAAEVTISYYGRQLDGLAVLREVRARGTLPGILLIGLGSATLVGQLSPHESFVMKPFADEQLRHTVQGLLRSPGRRSSRLGRRPSTRCSRSRTSWLKQGSCRLTRRPPFRISRRSTRCPSAKPKSSRR